MGPRMCGHGSSTLQASLLQGMWNLPKPGIEPVSPALTGRFFTVWATRESPYSREPKFFFFLRPSTDWMRPTTLWIVICFIQSWLCKHQSRLHNIITESRLIFGSVLKNLPANARDMGSRLERFLGEGNGNPLQYPCLGSPWPEEPDGLQSMRWQSQTQLSN